MAGFSATPHTHTHTPHAHATRPRHTHTDTHAPMACRFVTCLSSCCVQPCLVCSRAALSACVCVCCWQYTWESRRAPVVISDILRPLPVSATPARLCGQCLTRSSQKLQSLPGPKGPCPFLALGCAFDSQKVGKSQFPHKANFKGKVSMGNTSAATFNAQGNLKRRETPCHIIE